MAGLFLFCQIRADNLSIVGNMGILVGQRCGPRYVLRIGIQKLRIQKVQFLFLAEHHPAFQGQRGLQNAGTSTSPPGTSVSSASETLSRSLPECMPQIFMIFGSSL